MGQWQTAWGTYSKTGPYNNVAMGGTPSGDLHGLNFHEIHKKGYGRGIYFESLNNEGTKVKVKLDLVGYGVSDNLRYIENQSYVQGNFTYDWYADFYYSTNGGNSYAKITTVKVADHASTQTLYKRQGWQESTIKGAWNISLPNNFTHLKIEVRGDEPAQRHQNVYSKEVVVPPPPPPSDFRPWAIRKGSAFKSLEIHKGWFKVRKNNWVDKSQQNITAVGKENQGSSRIRKGGKWVGQNRIGG